MPYSLPEKSINKVYTEEERHSQGISLVEILLVIATISFLVILIASIPNALNLIGKSRHASLAREIASKAIEDQRAISYINLANGQSQISDSRINLLPSGSGSIEITDCPATVCSMGENIKYIKVVVSWKEVEKNQQIKMDTLVAEGGLNQ